MQCHFRVTPPSVHQMVVNRERVGLIRRGLGVARSIELLDLQKACLLGMARNLRVIIIVTGY